MRQQQPYHHHHHHHQQNNNSSWNENNYQPFTDGVFRLLKNGTLERDMDLPTLPVWQIADAKACHHTNLWNLRSITELQNVLDINVLQYGMAQMSPILEPFVTKYLLQHEKEKQQQEGEQSSPSTQQECPQSFLFYPLIQDTKIVGITGMEVDWRRTWERRPKDYQRQQINNKLDEGEGIEAGEDFSSSLRIILENTCQPNQAATFEIKGSISFFDNDIASKDNIGKGQKGTQIAVEYIGSGYYHETKFKTMGYSSRRTEFLHYYNYQHAKLQYSQQQQQLPNNNTAQPQTASDSTEVLCVYQITVYPSSAYEAEYRTWYPLIYLFITAGASFLIIALFVMYGFLLERRQAGILAVATRSDAIVKQLFPAVVRDRLFRKDNAFHRKSSMSGNGLGTVNLQRNNSNLFNSGSAHDFAPPQTARSRLGKFLNKVNNSNHRKTWNEIINDEDEPIAEMFTNTTVMFADIAGFTAWSSEREPSKVFKLLETLYHEFDLIAIHLNVFKVETIGDCYVAVSGLPEPQKNHAKIMARFASRILNATKKLTCELDSVLGPGTSDLGLRVGLHTGAVTAGVLRGAKSRFQLFGDTMNTASRMESTGTPGRIHVSELTAKCIRKAGKDYWLTSREDNVSVKGKGEMKTFWVEVRSRDYSIQSLPGTATTEDAFSGRDVDIDSSSSISDGNSGVSVSITDDLPPSISDVHDPSINDKNEDNGRPPLPVFHNAPIQNIEKISPVTSPPSLPCTFSIRQNSWNVWDGIPVGCTNNDGSVTSRSSLTAKESCLIRWNVDNLRELLEKVVQHRKKITQYQVSTESNRKKNNCNNNIENEEESHFLNAQHCSSKSNDVLLGPITNTNLSSGYIGGPIDEVVEVITLPKFCGGIGSTNNNKQQSILSNEVCNQLKEFVIKIASMYRDVPFHNFEHASHVTMSVYKLIKRIITPPEQHVDISSSSSTSSSSTKNTKSNTNTKNDTSMKWTQQQQKLHDFYQEAHLATFGISSDPLTQFAVVFSALIHDVDHTGLSNQQLIQDKTMISQLFHGKSVAEQNSVVLSWETLMDPQFKELRQCIFPTASEKKRFRQLIVNTVMATDILDPDMLMLRKNRWEKAFNNTYNADVDANVDFNRKATIVIEHIIQASDVAHTMQHWHIFIKWNTLLYRELYAAYMKGYSNKDPTEGWYEGQLKFYDHYVIPLAYKLRECGVFGVSGDEYLDYAQGNRAEWARKGHDETRKMIQRVHRDVSKHNSNRTLSPPPPLLPPPPPLGEQEMDDKNHFSDNGFSNSNTLTPQVCHKKITPSMNRKEKIKTPTGYCIV